MSYLTSTDLDEYTQLITTNHLKDIKLLYAILYNNHHTDFSFEKWYEFLVKKVMRELKDDNSK